MIDSLPEVDQEIQEIRDRLDQYEANADRASDDLRKICERGRALESQLRRVRHTIRRTAKRMRVLLESISREEYVEFTHDDICAAYFARRHPDLQEILNQAPDRESEDMARRVWTRGKEILKTHIAHASTAFPVGADPYGTRLAKFVHDKNIIAWTETFAGYVATAEHVRYLGLSVRE